MYIYNYSKTGNFGDALNCYMWPKLLGNLIEEPLDAVLIGIGSIMDKKMIERTSGIGKRLVFGAGFAYGKPATKNDFYKIYCVRGPLTAERVGIDKKYVVTDGGALIVDTIREIESRGARHKFAYMPHWAYRHDEWKIACERAGGIYIDPFAAPDIVVSNMLSSNLVITDALHGAICSDALRIPWIPVVHRGIHVFKWKDWCQSMGLNYEPEPIYLYYGKSKRCGIAALVADVRNRFRLNLAIMSLKHICSRKPSLSHRNVLNTKLSQLRSLLAELKNDIQNGIILKIREGRDIGANHNIGEIK